MIAQNEWPQKAEIIKVKFPTSNMGTALINVIINDLSPTCSFLFWYITPSMFGRQWILIGKKLDSSTLPC